MRKLILAACAVLALSACAPGGTALTSAPAPLAQTNIDEKGIIASLQAADAIATAVDGLVAAKVIVPGTPKAIQVRNVLVTLRSVLAAASAAQRAGNETNYIAAMRQAADAFTQVSRLLKS